MTTDQLEAMTDEQLDALDDDTVRQLKAAALQDQDTDKLLGRNRPLLVVEGDSWTSLPLRLELTFWFRWSGYRVRNFGRHGDTLCNMVHGSSDGFLATVEAEQPRAVFFSGGGNDVVGDALGGYLNHRDTGLPPLREDVWDAQLTGSFPEAFRTLTRRIRGRSPGTTVVVHGYARPFPTGDGYGMLLDWKGPWIKPHLDDNLIDEADRVPLLHRMIDEYNDMLASLAATTPGLVYVDVRDDIKTGDWGDELHPKNSAYRCAAATIADVLDGLYADELG
jgi:lysophospholipase L1-like esterase